LQDSPDYRAAIVPLRRILESDSSIAFVYTCVLRNGSIRFVLDPTDAGDSNGDGIDDKSYIMDPYPEAPPALVRALRTGIPSADPSPYTDRWGTFLSGYAPIKSKDGSVVAVVGVDLGAQAYVNRLASVRIAEYSGIALASVASFLMGFCVFLLSLSISKRSHERDSVSAAQRAHASALELVAANADIEQTLARVEEFAGRSAPTYAWRITIVGTPPPVGFEHRSEILSSAGLRIGTLHWTRVGRKGKDPSEIATSIAYLAGVAIERHLFDVNIARARDEAIEAANLKSSFLANMTHEIRTPMNGIMGMADLLIDSTLTRDQREQVDTIRESAQSLLTLINDILELSKLEAGKVEPDLISTDVGEVVSTACRLLSPLAAEQGLQIECDVDECSCQILTDPQRLRQILLNLLSNAIKFTSEGGVAVVASIVRASESEADLTLTVTDTGIGIPSDKLDAIFERFSQVHSSAARRFAGTGLGLAITKQLADVLGGAIEVESQLGRGSTFAFRLRAEIADASAEPGGSTAPAQARPASKRSLRVLVADDSAINLRVAAHLLKRLGHDVFLADGGEAAVRACRDAAFDLVLTDIEMPGMDGCEAAKAIRSLPDYGTTPIVALTAFDADDGRSASPDFDFYLPKPITQEALSEAIERLLAA
jgi:signal transduction histidine kinase